MSEAFLKIVNMSISASWLVLVVLALRFLLKKAPKWVNVLLWGLVAVRLICPFSVESAMSLIPSAEVFSPTVLIETPEINTGIPVVNNAVNPVIQDAVITLAPEKNMNAIFCKLSMTVCSRRHTRQGLRMSTESLLRSRQVPSRWFLRIPSWRALLPVRCCFLWMDIPTGIF